MGICKLFDRSDNGVEIRPLRPHDFQNNSLVVVRLHPRFDNCTDIISGETNYSKFVNMSSVSTYVKCLSSTSVEHPPNAYESTWSNTLIPHLTPHEFSILPKLHIVIFVTDDWMQKHRGLLFNI